jgi:hypothetical protein
MELSPFLRLAAGLVRSGQQRVSAAVNWWYIFMASSETPDKHKHTVNPAHDRELVVEYLVQPCNLNKASTVSNPGHGT